MLSQLRALKREQVWRETNVLLDEEFKRLVGSEPDALLKMSETELTARLIQGEPTQMVHQKMLLLTTLLMEAGEAAAAQNRPAQSRALFVKGLDLLLDAITQEHATELPDFDFVPKVGAFLNVLQDAPLPLTTQARLMQHYEQTGEFAKAENALFAMLDAEPGEPKLIEFGISFYRRLQNKTDDALAAGNLPRAELESGLADLKSRLTRQSNVARQ